jgi:hypothetical protein
LRAATVTPEACSVEGNDDTEKEVHRDAPKQTVADDLRGWWFLMLDLVHKDMGFS